MLGQQSARSRQAAPPPITTGGAVLPFDYATTFEIVGEPGRTTSNVIAISGDSAFVAVAIAYGFDEERGRPLTFVEVPAPIPILLSTTNPATPQLGEVPMDAWVDGVRLNAQFNPVAVAASADPGTTSLAAVRLRDTSGTPFEHVRPTTELTFLFSLIDTGSGRELQDEPTHNLAALGAADGRRPFRAFSRPIRFGPRSTLRLQIVERTPDVFGTLHVVLVGYKEFDASVCAPSVAAAGPTRPGARVVPFDFVVALDLLGLPGRVTDAELPVYAEAGAVITEVGYGLDTPSSSVPLLQAEDLVNVRGLPLQALGTEALLDGVRLRPATLPFAVNGDGGLQTSVSRVVADTLFERLNRPEQVAFLYEMQDAGTGREFQNRPLFNIAGLGDAAGRRPFKRLARPLELDARSVLRVTVQERFGRGRLYFAFQGYKTIGGRG